ncbi:MAG: 2Fe-2S iron-sulfur cluster binding domain-containing protein [Alphaproteobacteria bacterium]|nr:2Fe-2S iron-sulfur cluster binding domain-containing protein [Alphaproteobacteria bacterium]
MIKINFIQPNGDNRQVDGQVGHSVMEVAVANSVPGIDADCGGACACGTCHVYVDDAWLSKMGERTAMEVSMLEFAEGVETRSRLACQIKLEATLDGLTVYLPRSQH